MNYSIDTLIYESRGKDGGYAFITPKRRIKNVMQHSMRMTVQRNDGITLNYTDGSVFKIGETKHQSITEFEIHEGEKYKFNVVQVYLTSDKLGKTMDGEPCFGGMYVMFFYVQGTEPSIDGLINGFKHGEASVTECIIPHGFGLAGFHGKHGARLDKVGVILERIE